MQQIESRQRSVLYLQSTVDDVARKVDMLDNSLKSKLCIDEFEKQIGAYASSVVVGSLQCKVNLWSSQSMDTMIIL